MASVLPPSYVLPDLHAVVPFKSSFNPHFATLTDQSTEWIDRCYPHLPDKKRAYFRHKGCELLVAHAHPYADSERYQIICDLMNLVFVVDVITDVQNGKDAYDTCLAVYTALCDSTYDDGSELCKSAKR